MTLILIVAHAPLGSALAAVAEHVFAEKAGQLCAFDVHAQDSIDDIEAGIRRALDSHPGQEVLMLTDVFGASPCNAALRVADGDRIRLVAGVNVPMLWRALCYAEEPLERLLVRAMDGGTHGVMLLSSSLRQGRNQPSSPCTNDQVGPDHQQ